MHLEVQANNIFTVFCANVRALADSWAITRTHARARAALSS